MIRYMWLIKYRYIERIYTPGEMLKREYKYKQKVDGVSVPIAAAQRAAISRIRGKNGKRLLAPVMQDTEIY